MLVCLYVCFSHSNACLNVPSFSNTHVYIYSVNMPNTDQHRVVEVHLCVGGHAAGRHMTHSGEGGADTGEEEGGEGEEVGAEGGVEAGSDHLQDLKTVHHCLGRSSCLI